VGIYLKKYKRLGLLIGLYVLFLAAAQIIAAKIITVGPFVVPASIFIYPFTLLLIDCIVEFFWKRGGIQGDSNLFYYPSGPCPTTLVKHRCQTNYILGTTTILGKSL